MSDVIRVVIPRDKWVRGGRVEEFGYSELLNKRGNKCCLGHMGTACGRLDDEMRGIGLPSDCLCIPLAGDVVGYPDRLFGNIDEMGRCIEDCLTHINDAENVPDDIREAWIAEGFRHVGCEAVFVDSVEEANG